MLKCMKCNKEYMDNTFKFCPSCGSKLENQSGVSMFSKLGEEYKDTYGNWKVTTEGDCEGRSTSDLGTFVGHIDDIALFLANKCYYSLRFTKVKDTKAIKLTDNKSEVNVSLDIGSATWDMKPKYRVATMKELFKDRPVEIKDGNSCASFVIVRKCNHKDDNGNSLIKYDSVYEMRNSDMYCTKCGKSGSREELDNDTIIVEGKKTKKMVAILKIYVDETLSGAKECVEEVIANAQRHEFLSDGSVDINIKMV